MRGPLTADEMKPNAQRVITTDEADLLRELIGPRCSQCSGLILRAARHSADWHHIDQPADHQATPPERVR
jgi:hypothetical protein